MPQHIMVVEDDWLVGASLKVSLERDGFEASIAHDCESCRRAMRTRKPDLVLLDIGLPDCNGLDLARWLHSEMHVPFIFLTARSQEFDKVLGLELGASDYVGKPFSPREVLARVRTVLRHSQRSESGRLRVQREETLAASGVVLESHRHQVRVRGEHVPLTPKAFELLRLLMANVGTVLTHDYLLAAVWGPQYEGGLDVLYVLVDWLRDRIEDDPRHPQLIQTVRGVGYKFAASPAS